MKHRYFIDAHKGMTALVVLILIAAYGEWASSRAWLYWAVHGSYGVMWVTKSYVFPDSQWEKPVGWFRALYTFFGLNLYWIAPWLIVTHRTPEPPPWWLGVSVFTYALGVFLHYASDMQKYTALSRQPGKLFTDGLWSRLRNPNYLGELLIYASFGMIACHYVTFVLLGFSLAVEWIPNMLRKDRSLARYPEFAEWRARSWRMIPFVW